MRLRSCFRREGECPGVNLSVTSALRRPRKLSALPWKIFRQNFLSALTWKSRKKDTAATPSAAYTKARNIPCPVPPRDRDGRADRPRSASRDGRPEGNRPSAAPGECRGQRKGAAASAGRIGSASDRRARGELA